jgi:hypothetical protein
MQKILFFSMGLFFPTLLLAQNEIDRYVDTENQVYEKAASFLSENATSPETYLVEKFCIYDIILRAEDHAVQDNLSFINNLIPILYQSGVRNLGMEFGASEKQHTLDSLLVAPEFNEQLARDMMYFYNVGWAYKEYQELYRKAWEFNQSLPENAPKFRILNMSYQFDWSEFEGVRTPENMNKVFHKGTPDMYRAAVIENEIIANGEKILVLTGTYHAFTRYNMPVYSEYSDYFCDFNDLMLGNRLYKKYPEKVYTILLHQPFPAKPNRDSWLVSPANGAIEKIMQLLDNQPMGFDLLALPGKLPDDSFYSTCYANFTLGQLADGYIFLKPFKDLKGCEIDSGFFKGRNWEQIRKQIPDPDWRGDIRSLEDFIKQIRNYGDLTKRYQQVINH